MTRIRKMYARFRMMCITMSVGVVMVHGALSAQTGVVYQNDFAIRTSEGAADGWHMKDYVYPASLCRRFNYSTSNTRATPYGDLSQIQDGWFKSFGTATSMGQNAGYGMYAEVQTNMVAEYRTENDAANPFLALWSTGAYSVTNEMLAVHPLGNAFTSGVLRISVDMRTPSVWHGRAFFMVRPMFAAAMEAEAPQPDLYPMEFGLWNWTTEYASSYNAANQVRPVVNGGDPNANVLTKKRSDLMSWSPASNRWHRCVATLDLDSSTWRMEMYNMGTAQPLSSSSEPSSSYATYLKNASGSFYRAISDGTGPIAGVAFHAYHINRTYYNSGTYYQDNAARADNVKVEWKAPGSSEFVLCYENDFAMRRYRAVSPAATVSGTYAAAESAVSNVFSAYPTAVDKSIVNTKFFYTTIPWGGASASSYLGDPGIDGWRRLNAESAKANGSVHQWGGDGGAVMRILPAKAGENQSAFFVNRFAGGLTTGHVRLSADVRLPASWRSTTRHISVLLGSSALYAAAGATAASGATLAQAGVGSASDDGFNPAWLADGEWLSDSSAALTANEWYRIVITADLENRVYGYRLYAMGPDTVAASAAPAGAAVCERNDIAFSGGGADIGTIGVETSSVRYESGDSTAGIESAATLFDNLKVERSDDGNAWATIYVNDFATRIAYEAATAERPLVSQRLGVPEMNMDGWVRRGAGFGDVKVSGSVNPAAAFGPGADSACAVHALGKSIKDNFTFFVDVRPPVYWSLTNGFAHVILGGDEFYQGEIGTQAAGGKSLRNFEQAAALRFGIGHNAGSSAMLGVFRETDVCVVAGDGATMWNGTNLDRSLSRWYRFKAKVDLLDRTWSLSVLDMGTEHPSEESSGTLLGVRRGLPLGDMPADGITAIGLMVNGAPAGIRHYEDSDGGVLFDNIRVRESSGFVLRFR